MSTIHQACCCDNPNPCSDSCNFGSSYAVTGIAGSYRWQQNVATNSSCGQVCLFKEHDLQLSWAQLGTMTVTRSNVSGVCCYKGTGTVTVSGTLTIVQTYTGGPPGCPAQTRTDTYTFTRDVCCMVTVTCGGAFSCGWTPATAVGWTHSLHIGDFLITCSHSDYTGDCDTCVSAADVALRCIGGVVSHLSDLKALNTITKAQTGCLGYYTYGICNGDPYTAMHANVANYGPFGIVTDEECSEQDPYQSCTLPVKASALFSHRVDCSNLSTPWLCVVDSETKSFCGSTDQSVGPNAGCLTDYIQQGCGQIGWLYT